MTTKYSQDHEWISLQGSIATVGITDYAQEQLGEVVFVELPDIDTQLDEGDEAAIIESVKAAGELKSPASGIVTQTNELLIDQPDKVNQDPQGEGWFYKLNLSDASELDDMMDAGEYKSYLESLG